MIRPGNKCYADGVFNEWQDVKGVFLEYWFLFPVAMAIAVLAMSSGISGSNFWIPVYILWLGLDPKTGFWLALVTMLFGFSSGLMRNLFQGTVDWKLAWAYLIWAIPGAVVGTLLVPFSPARLLIGLFASFVLAYGIHMIVSTYYRPDPGPMERVPRARTFIAGMLKGLIATGLGKIIMPTMLRQKGVESAAKAVGTTVLVVFVINLIAVTLRLTPGFIDSLSQSWGTMAQILVFAVPGVVIGGQLGPIIAKRLSARGLRLYVGALLILVSAMMAIRALGYA